MPNFLKKFSVLFVALLTAIIFIGFFHLSATKPLNILGLFSKRGTAYKAAGSFDANSYFELLKNRYIDFASYNFTRSQSTPITTNTLTLWVSSDGVTGEGEISPLSIQYYAPDTYGSGNEIMYGSVDRRLTFKFDKDGSSTSKLAGYVQVTTDLDYYYGPRAGDSTPPPLEARVKWDATRSGDKIIGAVHGLYVGDIPFELTVVEEWNEVIGGEEPSKAEIVESRAKEQTIQDYKDAGMWPRYDFEKNEWMVDFSDEEVKEPGFREKWLVNRIKTQLKVAEVIEKIKGAITGEYEKVQKRQNTPL